MACSRELPLETELGRPLRYDFVHARRGDFRTACGPPALGIPEEISQLRSPAETRDALGRNGFRALRVTPGLRTLFAFKT